ncbi:interleukin-27 receptor subunit alpha [Buteo buteo]|uniref:interleukin-27 receptor subunit alpha n=1 Tax=Buteo buteo TaxID=30397 RepID=UPI003EBF8806
MAVVPPPPGRGELQAVEAMGGARGLRLLLLVVMAAGSVRGGTPELRCFRLSPRGGMNCSWGGPQPPPDPLVLRYQSLKMHVSAGARTARAQGGQRWVLVPRAALTAGDVYAVWVQGPGGQRVTAPLNLSLDHIVKPLPPQLQVNPSPPPSVRWMRPPGWEGGPAPPRCALRYRPHGHPTWTLVPEADLEPEGFEFEAGALEPGGAHEVQGRCAGEGGLWSDWSTPQAFTLPPHGLQEPLDVWRQEEESGGGQRGLILLWKDPSAGGGREYTVMVERDRGPPRRLHPPCCRCPLPPDTVSVAVTARGPPGPSAPARLRLDRTDLPPPRGVRVKPVPGPGLGVWWEPGGPPAAPQYLVEWAEVGAEGGLDWLRCPPGAHSTLLPGPLRTGARYRVRVHSLYPEGSGAAQATEAVTHLGVPPTQPPLIPVLCGAVAIAAAALLVQGLRPWCHRVLPVPDPRHSHAARTQDPPELGGPPCPPPEELPVTLVELSPEGMDMDPRPDADTELDRAMDTDRGTATATEPLVPPVGLGYERHFLPTPEEVLGWAGPTATHMAPVLTHSDLHSSDTDPEQPTATHTAPVLNHGDLHSSDTDPEQPTATHTAPVLNHGNLHSSDMDPEQPTATHTAPVLNHGELHSSDMDPEQPAATHTAPVLNHGELHSSDTDPEQPTETHTALELTHGDPHGCDMDPEQPTVIQRPWNQPTMTHTSLTWTQSDPHGPGTDPR